MKFTLIGIDLAKTIFQVCGVNQAGKATFKGQVRRQKLLELLLRYPDATIAMQALCVSHCEVHTKTGPGVEDTPGPGSN